MGATWAADWSVGAVVTKDEFRKSMGCVIDSTLSVAAASFDFTGLPTTYAHMIAVVYGRGDTAATSIAIGLRLNNDTTANYDFQRLRATASTVSGLESLGATTIEVGSIPAATAGANLFSTVEFSLLNYGGATNNKTVYSHSGWKIGTVSGDLTTDAYSGFWRSSAAVSRVTILPSAGNFAAGSRCSIYVMGS